MIERTLGAANDLGGNSGVVRGGIDALMAEQYLDHADISAVLQQVGGETVAERLLTLLMIYARRRFAIAFIPPMTSRSRSFVI